MKPIMSLADAQQALAELDARLAKLEQAAGAKPARKKTAKS